MAVALDEVIEDHGGWPGAFHFEEEGTDRLVEYGAQRAAVLKVAEDGPSYSDLQK